MRKAWASFCLAILVTSLSYVYVSLAHHISPPMQQPGIVPPITIRFESMETLEKLLAQNTSPEDIGAMLMRYYAEQKVLQELLRTGHPKMRGTHYL